MFLSPFKVQIDFQTKTLTLTERQAKPQCSRPIQFSRKFVPWVTSLGYSRSTARSKCTRFSWRVSVSLRSLDATRGMGRMGCIQFAVGAGPSLKGMFYSVARCLTTIPLRHDCFMDNQNLLKWPW